MTGAPPEIVALAEQRVAARNAKDFARADALRAEIAAAGYVVKDSTDGFTLERAATFAAVDPRDVPNQLSEPPTLDVSFHLLYEGFKEDVERFLNGFAKHNDTTRAEIVVVDNASADGEWIESLEGVRALHLSREAGWAEARNAGLKTSKGRLVALVDLSIEPTGDIVTPLLDAFEDPDVAVAGPFGLVSEAMRDWEPAEGPDADAVEGYFLVTRRELLRDKGLVHEKFKWYRNADIDLCFQVRAGGGSARVLDLPVTKHVHRGWERLDEDERAKRSKRNHYIFFDRWKHRPDLLLHARG